MAAPQELSFEEILKFMLAHNGQVTNQVLVKHFRPFLTNPETRDEARNIFKKHVNTLASIKNQNNEKWLILRKKYMTQMDSNTNDNKVNESQEAMSPNVSLTQELRSPDPPQYIPPPAVFKTKPVSTKDSGEKCLFTSPTMTLDNSEENGIGENFQQCLSEVDEVQPKLYPRKKSLSSTITSEHYSNLPSTSTSLVDPEEKFTDSDQTLALASSTSSLLEADHTVSVKERKQMFNKMASDMDVLRSRQYVTRGNAQGADEDDRASVISRSDVEPLDAKQKQWILCASRGDYHVLAKMCAENPKLVRTKDPFTYTAMHWACKRGDENIVKLLAGSARKIVNERSGYTPLHIAMQFRHENVYKLLVEVYDADPNVRDWSGRKPRQYLANLDTMLSPDAYRKFKIKADKKNFEKEGFLRIGSLNVRVKKTTEAFSNFLGVGATRASAYVPKSARMDIPVHHEETDQVHKNWGSADNITKDDKLMPPPSSNKIRKRAVSGRRGVVGAHSRSTPSTPDQGRAHIGGLGDDGDSDSDSAAGFHDAWRANRNSNIS